MPNRCKSCDREFRPHPQVPSQSYCSTSACQRERRRRWQQEKRRTDPDYRQNDVQYNHDWAMNHPGYWHQYRSDHPDYTGRNRQQQRERNRKSRNAEIANEDPSAPPFPLPSGRYRLIPITAGGIANGDEYIVEITVLPTTYDDSEP